MPNAAGDQFWSSVVLLLHADGANGSTTLTDSSNSAHSFTANGNAQLSTSRPKFGTAAMAFDGAGDYFQAANSADFAFGSGNWTIEGWAQADSVTGIKALIGYANGSATNANYEFQLIQNGTNLEFSAFIGTVQYVAKCVGVLSVGVTYSWCFERYNDTLYAYFNGTRGGTIAALPAAGTLNNPSASVLQIGKVQGSFDFAGMIDELRITKAGRYQGVSYTPATAAFPNQGLVATGFKPTNFGTGSNRRGQPATGFMPTHFGSAKSTYQQIEQATGFDPLHMGTPHFLTLLGSASGWKATHFGTGKILPHAVGWFTTVFGPSDRDVRRVQATGFASVHVGAPRLVVVRQASTLGRLVHFGTPWTPTNRTGVATALRSIAIGYAQGFSYTAGNKNRTLPVEGLSAVHLGKPAAHPAASGAATGWLALALGAAASAQSRIEAASGLASLAVFGAPSSRETQRASGVRMVHFGSAGARSTCHASGIAPRATFGTCTYTRPAAHFPRGWIGARFGHPRALRRFNYPASGFPATHMGSPAAFWRLHAQSMPPTVRAGTPQAVRNPKC